MNQSFHSAAFTHIKPALISHRLLHNPKSKHTILDYGIMHLLSTESIFYLPCAQQRKHIKTLSQKTRFLFNGISTHRAFQILSAPGRLLIMLIKCLKGKTIANFILWRFLKEKALHCNEILLQQIFKDNWLTERKKGKDVKHSPTYRLIPRQR